MPGSPQKAAPLFDRDPPAVCYHPWNVPAQPHLRASTVAVLATALLLVVTVSGLDRHRQQAASAFCMHIRPRCPAVLQCRVVAEGAAAAIRGQGVQLDADLCCDLFVEIHIAQTPW